MVSKHRKAGPARVGIWRDWLYKRQFPSIAREQQGRPRQQPRTFYQDIMYPPPRSAAGANRPQVFPGGTAGASV